MYVTAIYLYLSSHNIFFSESLHTHFNPSQNVSSILLLNCLMMFDDDVCLMFANEGSIARKLFK